MEGEIVDGEEDELTGKNLRRMLEEEKGCGWRTLMEESFLKDRGYSAYATGSDAREFSTPKEPDRLEKVRI